TNHLYPLSLPDALPICRYSGDTAEHNAVRNNAGLFDISHMGEIRVSGPQAGEALDYALVGHASAIKPGRARYTMICNAEGGVLRSEEHTSELQSRENLV